MTRFFIFLLGIGAALVIASYAGASAGYFAFPSFLWPIEICLISATAAIFYFLYGRPPGMGFTQVYLFSIVTKICVFGILMMLVIVLDKPGAGENVVLFLISYGMFTVLEVALLFRKING